jgi:hypothetical protein
MHQQPEQQPAMRQNRRATMSYTHDLTDIKQTLRDLTKTSQDTVIAVTSLQQIAREQHERIARLENAPTDMRQVFTGYGGCLASAATAGIALLALLISLVGVLAQHWH